MMWRWSCIFLKQSLSSAVGYKPKVKAALGLRAVCALFSTESGGDRSGSDVVGGEGDNNNNNNNSSMSFAEAKKLMRLVNVEALKMKLGGEEKEVICYSELLQACESIGVAKSRHEAATFARVLDEAGVVLLFRDKVYLHPDKRNLKVAVRISQATSFSVKFHTIVRDALKASFTEPEPTTNNNATYINQRINYKFL